jgi:hypothetical protein
MSEFHSLERRARAYISAVEGGATGEELAGFYHPEAIQTEFPNRLAPNGVQRALDDILRGAEAGQKLMARQIFDINTVTQAGDRIVLEMTWTGHLAEPIGLLRAGDTMRAHFVQVIEFEDGLIIRQRNYDCFEPF